MKSFELAFRMQVEAPEITDISKESPFTRKLYGMDEPETKNFGHQCLMARRLAERGVRFIQVSHAHSLPFNNEQWDQHSHLEQGHSVNVKQIDKPITGLILDLKARGLLDDTLVLWGVIIILMDLPCGWQVGVREVACVTERPTSLATMPSGIDVRFTICMRQYCMLWG